MIANFFRSIDRTIEYTLFLFFLAFTLVGGLQVFNRFVLGLPLSWSEEFQKFGHIWMVMLAIPVAYRRGAHLGMDTLYASCLANFSELSASSLKSCGWHWRWQSFVTHSRSWS